MILLHLLPGVGIIATYRTNSLDFIRKSFYDAKYLEDLSNLLRNGTLMNFCYLTPKVMEGKGHCQLAVVVHTFNPSSHRQEAGGVLNLRPASSTE